MIYMRDGAKDRDNYYTQTNNPTEQILKKYKGGGYLVSCGPTAMINCIAPFGARIRVTSPTGQWDFQPEECVTDFLNDPRVWPKLKTIRDLDLDKVKFPLIMVQEYGRYFGIPTVCLRGGCLTGPNHSGVELHGFLSYLVKCCDMRLYESLIPVYSVALEYNRTAHSV